MPASSTLVLEAVCIGSACASTAAYAVSQLADRALQKLVVGAALREAHDVPPDDSLDDVLARMEQAEIDAQRR